MKPSASFAFKVLMSLGITLSVSSLLCSMEFIERRNNILMQGEIRKGDYEKFRKFMRDNFDAYVAKERLVMLDSRGGDLVETLKIAGRDDLGSTGCRQ